MRQSTGTNIQVAVRCRPLNADEKKAGMTPAVTCDIESKAININYGNAVYLRRRNLTFDHVFGPYSRQEEVFDALVRPMIDDALSGFNCTIFAYGQTGTGKTHTMEGVFADSEESGIVPRAVKSIYGQLEQGGAEFSIRVSYLELYNEELLDLFDPYSSKKLQLCEDAKKGVICQNLEEIPVISMDHILEILQKGFKQRQCAATLMNKNSSRSHSIFTMKIMIKEYDIDGEEMVRHGQLNLVDLAGSECVGRSGAKEERAREAGSINQSLLTLGRVINALVEHHGHIPYRDSKLTRLLQDSLGGRSKTSIIATLSPSSAAVDETISTLEYAFRAKTIKNQPVLNQKLTKHVIMKDFMTELEMLRGQLQQTREKVGVYMKPNEFADLQAKMRAQESQLQECETALKLRTEELKVNKAERDDFAGKYERNQTLLVKTTAELEELSVKYEKQTKQFKDTAIELHATGSVVAEQVVTEQHLYVEGQKLEKDLNSRNSDINRLLSKIDALSVNDQAKSAKCNLFVTELQDDHRKLLNQVETAKLAIRQDVDALIGSNRDLLSTSKETYSQLQSVVSTCLSKIQLDTETAGSSLSTLQGSVKDDLKTLLTSVTDSLGKLQDVSLAPLFANLYARINHAENLMESHQAQLEDVVYQIHTHFSTMSAKSADYLQQQEKFREALYHATSRLKEDVSAQLEFQKSHAEAYIVETETAMSAKVTEIELKMKAMLKDLVAESSALLEKGREESEVIASDTNNKVVEKTNSIISAGDAHYSAYLQHLESEQKEVAAFKASSDLQLKNMQQCYDGIRPQHYQMRQTVEEIKASVSESSTEIVATTTSTVQNGCYAAEAIEATSVQLHKDITSNAVESAAIVKESTEFIASYISDKHCSDVERLSGLAGELQAHFLSEEDSLTQHSKAAATLHADITPLCSVYAVGEQLIRRPIASACEHRQTREHAVIKEEVRERLVPLQLDVILAGNPAAPVRLVTSPVRSPMVEINCSKSRSFDSTASNNKGKNGGGLVPESEGYSKKKKESGKENHTRKPQQKFLSTDRIGSVSFEERNAAAEPAIALEF